MAFRRVANADSLWSGEMRGVVVEGRRILLVNVDGQVSAFRDQCLHLSVPLSEGHLRGRTLVCSAHEWEYDPCTGRGVNPEGIQLEQYAVRQEDDAIWVDVETVITTERRLRS